MDQPNPKDFLRAEQRMQLLKEGKTAEANALGLSGTDRVLVILVEFAGTDTFTWTNGTSHWDPLNIADTAQDTGVAGDCSLIITSTQTFTYTGPLHNQIERPLSEADRSGQSIWTEDFNPQWFNDFMFGSGVVISYTRQDSSQVYANFQGKSVKDFYSDLSNGAYNINGDVVGWLQMPHSTMYYDADQCPGARSVDPNNGYSPQRGGMIPGAGSARDLVKDALAATNAISNTIPGFDWRNYDQNGDGVIDRLWIVHAGYGEEDSTTLLNRTTYGEASVWSHSSSVSPVYPVGEGISAGPYIMMPENGGIGVFAHEYGHNLGALDLYAYGYGETSAGFWTTMSDDWTGYPIGFEPPAQDPMHLDRWGWLNPLVVTDTSKVYEATIGQASRYPGGTDMVRGVRIDLPTGLVSQPVPVWQGDYYWWGGKRDQMNSKMTSVASIDLTGTTAPQLSFDLVYDIEDQWDYMWVQASKDGGSTWDTITNTNQVCTHNVDWIGGLNGFPDDLCAAGIYGFTSYNASWPDPETEVFDLSKYIGEHILVRLWYMTDWGTTYTGTFVDNVVVSDGATTLFSDDAEAGDANWTYAPDWARSNGTKAFDHSLYLQWRNTHTNGGYDEALGDTRWRYGAANTGLLVWYENQSYSDNEVYSYLSDYPSYGPKGRMLVIDSQPEPYRSPFLNQPTLFPNEGANLEHRSLMRDAPFTLAPTVDFDFANTYLYPPSLGVTTTHFSGRTAVNVFHDALGYYPGSEYVKRGPFQGLGWVTKQWDASTVVPAKSAYAVKAPGYIAGSTFRDYCYIGWTGSYYALYCAATPMSMNGGNGNPADVDGQYGWHVEVVDEATDHTWGKVRIWNSQYAVDSTLTPDVEAAKWGDTINFTAQFKNAGSEMSYIACVPLDTTKVEYVAGSATGGAAELTSCPTSSAMLSSLKAPSASTVGALAWIVNDALPGATTESYAFQVMAKGAGKLVTKASVTTLTLEGTIYTSLTTQDVKLVENLLFLPTVSK
jgi:immune inhibitor A